VIFITTGMVHHSPAAFFTNLTADGGRLTARTLAIDLRGQRSMVSGLGNCKADVKHASQQDIER
jgi:hypothetical protein